ncbi:DUF695 domain-containing protein [Nitrogeniibacter aestuarii]|uniref:DUF695 domain-containing protein n=1 Tax=Nitrogeniibacter aestuarii TaxID=2815343 RepID=UPI001D0FC6CF|nr:DUF695 domain-containing protein [Nitrogeniibacter aestuarii]
MKGVGADEDKDWVVTRLMGDKGLCQLRVARLPEGFDFSAYADRVHILWRFDGGDEAMPSAAEEAAMAEFEHALVDMLRADRQGALVMVLNELGHREFVIHITREDRLIHYLNTIDEAIALPIEVQADSDADGTFFKAHAGHLLHKTA